MKHIARTETAPASAWLSSADGVAVTHVGSGQQFHPSRWPGAIRPPEANSAEHTFQCRPRQAGAVQVELKDAEDRSAAPASSASKSSGCLAGRPGHTRRQEYPGAGDQRAVAGASQLRGGRTGRKNLPVTCRHGPRHDAGYRDHDEFSFQPPRARRAGGTKTRKTPRIARRPCDRRTNCPSRWTATVRTGDGAGIPASRRAQELVLEASYADPKGEVQTRAACRRCGLPAWSRESGRRAGFPPARDRLPGAGAANGRHAGRQRPGK